MGRIPKTERRATQEMSQEVENLIDPEDEEELRAQEKRKKFQRQEKVSKKKATPMLKASMKI